MRRLRNLFSLFFLLLLGCVSSPHAGNPPHSKIDFFLHTPEAEKLSPALQKKLRTLEAEGGEAESLSLLLGLRTSPTEAEKDRLRQEGALLRSIIGAVATVTAPAEKIPAISRLDFVETIELVMSFRQKGEPDEGP